MVLESATTFDSIGVSDFGVVGATSSVVFDSLGVPLASFVGVASVEVGEGVDSEGLLSPPEVDSLIAG